MCQLTCLSLASTSRYSKNYIGLALKNILYQKTHSHIHIFLNTLSCCPLGVHVGVLTFIFYSLFKKWNNTVPWDSYNVPHWMHGSCHQMFTVLCRTCLKTTRRCWHQCWHRAPASPGPCWASASGAQPMPGPSPLWWQGPAPPRRRGGSHQGKSSGVSNERITWL